jgi:hypothetical protein
METAEKEQAEKHRQMCPLSIGNEVLHREKQQAILLLASDGHTRGSFFDPEGRGDVFSECRDLC